MKDKVKNYTELEGIVESYKRITQFTILIYENNKLDAKHQILRNFTAKSHSLLNSINVLLSNYQEGEAMALYRLLIERYFYLEYLEQTGKYQDFKDWSYIKTYESRNRTRSNTEYSDEETKKALKDSLEQTRKYQTLKKKKIEWIEPKLEKFAKELNLSFLYKMGYDLGSSFVHPRADEGYWDAIRIASNSDMPKFRRYNILKNSILMANSILIFAANHTNIDFGRYLNYYCNSIFGYINENKKLPDFKNIEKIYYADLIAKTDKMISTNNQINKK